MSLKITGLSLDNYKRITLAKLEFNPDQGGVVALMGPNEAGKSSALDGFEALIAGRKAPKQSMPIHKGADKATIIGTFREDDGTEIVVTREYTSAGTSIKVRQDGLAVSSPDRILSSLYSHVALDPLAFANLGSKEQVETLLALIGFDPAKLDEEAANVYATRTEVGRDVKRLTEQLKSFPKADEKLMGTPLVDVATVQQTLEDAREHNETRRQFFAELESVDRSIVTIEQEIADEEERLASMRRSLEARKAKAAEVKLEAEGIAELPLQGYLDQIASADETNQAIRAQQQRAAVESELTLFKETADKLSTRLDAIAEEKAKGFADADMPIPGLTVESGEVYLDGTPFSQTSAGGKLRTSTAIAMALNPELRAIVIRDGSLLDASNRAIINELARDNDFTVLMEIVDQNAPAGVVFEDGRIVDRPGTEDVTA